jgi:hypothetical protein
MALAEYLTKDDRSGVFRRLTSRLRVDWMKLHRLLALVPGTASSRDLVTDAERRNIGLLQAVRLSLLMHMFLRAVQVPPFSRSNDVSRDDVLEMVLSLRVDDALAQLRRAYPAASPEVGDFCVDEPSDFPDHAGEDMARSARASSTRSSGPCAQLARGGGHRQLFRRPRLKQDRLVAAPVFQAATSPDNRPGRGFEGRSTERRIIKQGPAHPRRIEAESLGGGLRDQAVEPERGAQVASVEKLRRGKTRPVGDDPPAFDGPAQQHGHRPRAMIGAARAIGGGGAANSVATSTVVCAQTSAPNPACSAAIRLSSARSRSVRRPACPLWVSQPPVSSMAMRGPRRARGKWRPSGRRWLHPDGLCPDRAAWLARGGPERGELGVVGVERGEPGDQVVGEGPCRSARRIRPHGPRAGPAGQWARGPGREGFRASGRAGG